MRLALISDVVYPYTKGGAERRFYEIGQRIGKEHDVHVFCMKYWRGPDVIKQGHITLHGVCKPKQLYISSGRRSITEALYFGWKLYKPLRRECFDLIDCSGFPYFSLFACRIAKHDARLVSTWHEVWGKKYWLSYLGIRGYIGAMVEWLAIKIPERIISVSQATARKLKLTLHTRKPITVVPNGVDCGPLRRLKQQRKLSDVLFVGRLIPEKGADMLLRAMAKLPGKTLTILGEGPEEERLRSLARELDIVTRVEFLPFQKEPEQVYRRMAASRLLVLPSRREGFGIVVLEANACGIPVVTTDHPDNAAADLIHNGKNGMVCAADEKSLAEAVRETLKRRIGKASCYAAAATYDWNKIANLALRIYVKAVENAGE